MQTVQPLQMRCQRCSHEFAPTRFDRHDYDGHVRADCPKCELSHLIAKARWDSGRLPTQAENSPIVQVPENVDPIRGMSASQMQAVLYVWGEIRRAHVEKKRPTRDQLLNWLAWFASMNGSTPLPPSHPPTAGSSFPPAS